MSLPPCNFGQIVFEEADIDDWKDRLEGFGSDGAAVNIRCRNEVALQLLRDIPYLIYIHCVAHRLELCVTKAIKEWSSFRIQ